MLELQGIMNGLIVAGVYMLVAVGLTLIFGTMRLANFAHGDFLMLGMYLAYFSVVSWGLPLYLTLFLSVPILLLAGVVAYFIVVQPIIKARPENMFLSTFGLALVLSNVALIVFSGRVRAVPDPFSFKTVQLAEITVGYAQITAAAASLIVVLLIALMLYRTEPGRAIRAISEDRDAASLMGIDVTRTFALSFGVGTACLGAAAPLIIPFQSVNPDVGLSFSLIAFLIIIIGGLGSLRGAILASLLVGITDGLGSVLFPGAQSRALVYGLFLLVILLKPTGMFGQERL